VDLLILIYKYLFFASAGLQLVQSHELRAADFDRRIPGQPSTQTGFGALVATTSPPTGLLGVGLGGDNSPRMVALQLKVEF